MRLERLYYLAKKRNYTIKPLLCNKKGYCFKYDNSYYIGLNYDKLENSIEEKQVLAEELGHCEGDYFYCISQMLDPLQLVNISRAEANAKKWAFSRLLPIKKLVPFINDGFDEYKTAEVLDVGVEFLREALDYYKTKNLL